MSTLIIVSGNCGSTLRAAVMLRDALGDADIFNTAQPDISFDFKQYDNYVFGTNIRAGNVNKRFKKWAKALALAYTGKNVYAYFMCANPGPNERYAGAVREYVPSAREIRCFGGEIDGENTRGISGFVMRIAARSAQKKGRELPYILEDEVYALADEINRAE